MHTHAILQTLAASAEGHSTCVDDDKAGILCACACVCVMIMVPCKGLDKRCALCTSKCTADEL